MLEDGSGQQRAVRSHYLVGADGSRSTVREAIGAKLEGRYGLSRNYNIVFRAPGLARGAPPRPGHHVLAGQPRGVERDRPDGPRRHVVLHADAAPRSARRCPTGRPPKLIRRATGIDLPLEILSRDEWVASELLADRYRDAAASSSPATPATCIRRSAATA